MASFDKIKVGDELWDCRRQQMGNTTMRQMCCWKVTVKEINKEKRQAFCCWNGNAPTWWPERRLKSLRRTRADVRKSA